MAVGGVRDNGTSYLQVGLNNKIQFSYLKKKKKKARLYFTFHVTHITFVV